MTKAKIVFHSSSETATRRTLELSATNSRLKRCIARHKIAEATLKKSCEDYRTQLSVSMRLQNDLRQLTRHILNAQEDERHKISHDLQDEIAQTLLGINVRLLSLKTLTEDSTERLKDEVARTQQLVTESSLSVQKYARELDIHQKLPFHCSATRLIKSETPKTSLRRKSPSKS